MREESGKNQGGIREHERKDSGNMRGRIQGTFGQHEREERRTQVD
jgi:hypothetical protein